MEIYIYIYILCGAFYELFHSQMYCVCYKKKFHQNYQNILLLKYVEQELYI